RGSSRLLRWKSLLTPPSLIPRRPSASPAPLRPSACSSAILGLTSGLPRRQTRVPDDLEKFSISPCLCVSVAGFEFWKELLDLYQPAGFGDGSGCSGALRSAPLVKVGHLVHA